jgi:hypothetical protein
VFRGFSVRAVLPVRFQLSGHLIYEVMYEAEFISFFLFVFAGLNQTGTESITEPADNCVNYCVRIVCFCRENVRRLKNLRCNRQVTGQFIQCAAQ